MGNKTVSYFVVALLISMSIAHLLGWDERGGSFYEESASVFADDEQMEEITDTNVEEIKMKRISQEEPTYQLLAEIPVFDRGELDEFFDEDAEQRIEHFITLIEHNGRVSESHPGAYQLTSDFYQSGQEFFSVVMSEEMYTGGANFDQKAHVYLVDLQRGEFIDPVDLFDNPFAAQERLFESVEENLRASEYYADYILDDNLNEWLNQDEYDFSNVFIRNENLVLKFDKYEVTSGVAGMPEVEVELELMEEFFDEDWLKRIQAIDPAADEYFLYR